MGKMFLQLSHPLQHFWQFLECGDGAQPFFRIKRWRSAHDSAGLDVAANATLSVNGRAVMNCQVAGDADLARQQHALSKNAGSCQTRLSADNVVLADHAGVTD